MNMSKVISSMIASLLVFGMPTALMAHVGHGDEFQSTGGIERVKVNAKNDPLLGIVVTPIEQAAEGGTGVMIPTTALVEADGKQLVFVQYENFYEPIEVTTGMTDGDLIQVTEKLSVGEKLVTEGSLMLYAQSRKTQPTETTETTETAPTPAAIASPDPSHAQADAQGIPHQHDTAGNMANSSETGQAVGIPIMVIVGGMVGLLVGGTGLLFLLRSFNLRKKNSRKSRNKEISKPEHSYRE